MSAFILEGPPLKAPPDDLAIDEFVFDYAHPGRPVRPADVPCFIEDESGRAVYLEELKERVTGLSASLQHEHGVVDDDVACLCSPNHVDYPVVAWAVLQAGGIVATINPSLTVQEMEYQFRVANPKLIFAHAAVLNVVQAALKNIPDCKAKIITLGGNKATTTTIDELIDLAKRKKITLKRRLFAPGESRRKIAFLCFSSGTTGPPKAVAISHYNITYWVIQFATSQGIVEGSNADRFRVGDVSSGILPFFHIYGLAFTLHFLTYAAMPTVVSAAFNFEKLLQHIVRYRITHLSLVPPVATLFAKHPAVKSYDISHVRLCVLAAAPASAELMGHLLKLWPHVYLGQGYGLTESAGGTTMWPLSQRVGTLGSAGHILPGVTFKLVKEDGTLAPRGEPGELWLKGPQVTLGYYNNQAATKECFVDGWLRTGDQVVIAENGDIFVVDRIKEMIKVKAFQVSPAELEGHLLAHPDVADVGVVGMPDDYSGELPVAFVLLRESAAERVKGDATAQQVLKANIMKHVQDAKSRYKWLKEVYFVDAIPKNPSGKILRRVLRDQAANMDRDSRPRL